MNSLTPIGIIHSPYKEKFSIPRQPNLVNLPMKIELFSPYNIEIAFKGIEEFSHLWIIFNFHQISKSEEKLTVRPPRLGGNIDKGVFATRSPFRPNRLGLSVVKFVKFEKNILHICGGDFLDQTPVYDIKPYIKEIESIPNAICSFTDQLTEQKLNVVFDVENDFLTSEEKKYVCEILSLDPRPRFHLDEHKDYYGVKLFSYDFHFKVKDNTLTVFKIITL